MKKIIYVILFLLIFIMLASCTNKQNAEQKSFWIDNYFQQDCAITPQPGDSVIKARVDGKWGEFQLVEFPDKFMEWDVEKRIETLDRFLQMKPPELAGPHNGIVATYGCKREDSQFKLNNAVKGMGFLPKAEKLPELIKLMEDTTDSSFVQKLEILRYFYTNIDSLFDLDRQVSLELYSTPEFETQTFLNQMTDPSSTIVFLDIPSYKLKTIARLLHPDDPDLTEYEKLVVRYINDVHSYFHGKFPRDYPAVIYFVSEIYDNSPGRRDAMGRRIVP
ncbi:MAG: hypothetical protein H8E22_04425 [Candidatus Cloacimonetes bacterium]|nr:hypothetical protein [Candidatus Cloacimonadota bacterium]